MRKLAPGFISATLARSVLLVALGYSGVASALVTFNGTNGVDARIISNGGCAGCHGTSTAAACTGTAVSTLWLDDDSASARRTTTSSCYTDIADKISASPSYGVRMPQGGPFFGASDLSLFSQWNTDGRLLHAAPTVTTQSATSITNSSATLRSATAANGASTNVNYRYALNFSLTSSPVTTANTAIGSGGGTGTSSANRAISGLNCGTTYYFRAQGTNSQGTTNGSTLNFNTSACSSPSLSLSGAGSSSGNRIFVPKNGSFTQASLTISTSDADTFINSWTFGTPSSGSLSGVNTSTGAFTYNAPATAGNATFTIRVTDNDPASGGGPNNSLTRTVYITVTDTAPQFRSALFPGGGVIVSDSLTVSEGNGSTPSQTITMFAYDADGADTISWSVFSGPSQGSLGAFGSGTTTANSSSNSISYTPNNNVDTNDSFTIRISDGTTNVDLPITANVTPVPDNPTAGNDGPIDFDIGVPVAVNVLANDNDVDTGDSVSVDPTSITVSAGG